MLRGSYAGGSLAVTARCPCRRSGPSAHPACPRPGSRPARDASRSRFGCCDSLSNALAIRGCATPLRVQVSRCIAVDAPGRAVPLRCLAFQILRRSNLRRALPSPCHVSLCLRQALLRKATPSLPVSVHRRRMPRLCFAVACAALLLSAVAVPGTSWPSYPMPLRIGSLPVLRGAVRFAAPPSHLASKLCWAVPSQCQASQCFSFATLDLAVPILRRSRLSRAFPSPRRANQSISFANPRNAFPSQLPAYPSFSVAGLRAAVLFFSIAALLNAKLFRRLPEQIKALPLPSLSPHLHGRATPCFAHPSPGSPSQSLSAATPS